MDISIYQKFGTKTRTRYADVNKIGISQGQGVCDSLIGLHAFTGYDSVSCFAGKGKLIALQLLKKDPSNQTFNGPVVKSVESVLRLEGSLWRESFVEEVGLEPEEKERGSYGW